MPTDPPPSAAAARARALSETGDAHLAEQRYDEARAAYAAARDAWLEVGDVAAAVAALASMAHVYLAQGDTDNAIRLFGEVAEAYRVAGDVVGQATSFLHVAGGRALAGQLDLGLEACAAAADCFRQVGRADGVAAAESRAARLLWRLGRRDEAAVALDRSVAALEDAGLGETSTGETLALLHQHVVSVRAGVFPEANRGSILPAEEVEAFIQNTVAVLTVAEAQREAWQANIVKARDDALARGGAWRVEAEFFAATLELMEGRQAELPADHPYAPVLAAIRTGVAHGGPQEIPVAREIVDAVRAFVATEDWPAARRLLEERQEILLRPEVDAVFARNIEAAMSAGDARGARVLALHRDVLRVCRDEGIETGFTWLQQQIAEADARASAAETEAALPADFVARCVSGLLGTTADRVALFSYLQGLGRFDRRLQPLTDALQRAALEGDMGGYGHDLSPPHAAVWRRLREAVSRGDRHATEEPGAPSR